MMLGTHYELKIFKNINWDDGLSYKPIHNEGIDLKGGYYTINIAYFMIFFFDLLWTPYFILVIVGT